MKFLKRLKRGLIGLLVLSACVALAVKFLPRERDLMAEATKVADMSDWWEKLEGGSTLEWLSEDVLFSHPSRNRLYKPFTFDVNTGKKAPLTELHRHIMWHSMTEPTRWQLSPDGQWMLWVNEFSDEMRVSKLDGSQYQAYDLPGHGNSVGRFQWKEDSRHWMAEHVLSQKEEITGIFEGNVNMPGTPGQISSGAYPTDNHFPEENSRGQFLLSSYVSRRCPRDRKIVLKSLPDAEELDFATDDSGERIIYLFCVTHRSAFLDWLNRLFPRRAPLTARLEMWVGRADGTEMRFAGYLTGPETADYSIDQFLDISPCYLRWLPDGKRISFVYKGALYTVPVD